MIYQFENISYDSINGNMHVEDKEIKLTKIQAELLNYLIKNPKTIISKQTLMDDVWGRSVSENSVDQVILILRGHLESDPTKPQLLTTHFGRGISFEAVITANKLTYKTTENSNKTKAFKLIPLIVLSLALLWFAYNKFIKTTKNPQTFDQSQQVLILPVKFNDDSISEIDRKGSTSLIKSTFNSLDSEGKVIFDEVSPNTQHAIEKHWQLKNNLIVLSTEVIKSGEIYQAVIELTSGAKTVESTTLKANSLENLLNQQISFISRYNQRSTNTNKVENITSAIDQLYIKALGYKKAGNLIKAKELLQQVLLKQEDNFQARLTLSDILLLQKDYDWAESQLNTLKATKAYSIMATEIELNLAKIKFAKQDYDLLINDLKNYQASHLSISQIKKAKIQLAIARAYLALGDSKNALLFYKQSLRKLVEQLNPEIYAMSYYGQGKTLQTQSNNEDTLSLFKQSLVYAQSAGDLHQQVLALNEISSIAFSNYDWDKAIATKKQALQTMELVNDKEEIANGLGSLVAMLNLDGNFSEAQKINQRLGSIATELNSSTLQLHYLHYDAILAMNAFNWKLARQQIDKQLLLAQKTKNYPMQLDNAFLEFELLLALKETKDFKAKWDERVKLINKQGFTRYQLYMDVYLIRYYNLTNLDKDAIELINQTSKQAKNVGDISILVDAQIQLAEIFLKTDANKALQVLNDLEQHNPQPNPYLEIKARTFNKLGKPIQALNLLNQAKLVFNEGWTAKNQTLLETIQRSIQ